MPTSLSEIARWALVAQASYAHLSPPSAPRTPLLQSDTSNFVLAEANQFLGLPADPNDPLLPGIEVRDQRPNDPTGFSATVFFDRSSNKYVLGIRGTDQTLSDGVEDVLRIGGQGFAGDQLVSLYRYYKRLTTPAGQAVQYQDGEVSMLQAVRLGIPLSPAYGIFNVARTLKLRQELAADVGITPEVGGRPSVIPAGTPLVVAGHSLGGHLALLFGRFFPEVTEHVYTYNAPGISPVGELTLRAMGIAPIAPSLVT